MASFHTCLTVHGPIQLFISLLLKSSMGLAIYWRALDGFFNIFKKIFFFPKSFCRKFQKTIGGRQKNSNQFSSLASFTIILDWLKWVFGWWRSAEKKVASHELGRSKLLKFHSKVVGITRVTRWQDHFFNVWLFTTMNTYLPNSIKMSLGKFQSLPKSK